MKKIQNNVELDIIGKELSEAEKIASDNSFSIRVVEKDGNSLMITMDLRFDRINVRLKNGKVISTSIG